MDQTPKIDLRQTCNRRGCYCVWCREDSIIKPDPPRSISPEATS